MNNITITFGNQSYTTTDGKKPSAKRDMRWAASMKCPVVKTCKTESEWAVARLTSDDLGVSSKALLAIGLGSAYGAGRPVKQYVNGEYRGTKTPMVDVNGRRMMPSDPADLGRCLRTFTCAPAAAKARMKPVLAAFIDEVCEAGGSYEGWRAAAEKVLNR